MGEAVRQMFTAIAQHYDVLNTVLSFGLHHYWRQQAVAVSGIPSGAMSAVAQPISLSPLPVTSDTMDRSLPWTFVRQCLAVATRKPCNKGSILRPLWPMHNTSHFATPSSMP